MTEPQLEGFVELLGGNASVNSMGLSAADLATLRRVHAEDGFVLARTNLGAAPVLLQVEKVSVNTTTEGQEVHSFALAYRGQA